MRMGSAVGEEALAWRSVREAWRCALGVVSWGGSEFGVIRLGGGKGKEEEDRKRVLDGNGEGRVHRILHHIPRVGSRSCVAIQVCLHHQLVEILDDVFELV
jgi:hypothetical protein